MGLHSISLGSILVVVMLALLIFGSRRMRSVGQDVAKAIKDFRRGVDEESVSSHTTDEAENKQAGQ